MKHHKLIKKSSLVVLRPLMFRVPAVERSPAARLLGADLRGVDFEKLEKLEKLSRLQGGHSRSSLEVIQVCLLDTDCRAAIFLVLSKCRAATGLDHIEFFSIIAFLPKIRVREGSKS